MLDILPSRSDAALRRTIRHAAARVPYYRELFARAGLDPRAVRTLADLATLPVTTKAELQRDPDGFVTEGTDRSRLLVRTTSGSTGQPVTVRNSAFDEFRRHLARWRVDIGYGVRPGDRRMRFRAPGAPLAGDRILLSALSATGLYHQEKVASHTEGAECIDALVRFRPTTIDGAASAVHAAARAALERGETRVRPRYVVTGGEVLSPEARRRIGEAFGAPVYDIFGSVEMGVIAHECPSSGLYHLAAGAAVELLDADGNAAAVGEAGHVVATSLTSRTVPVIRYETGDCAVRGPDECPCGARVGTLREILGRTNEFFRLADGRELRPWRLPFRWSMWIRTFQFEQVRENAFVLRYTASPDTSADDIETLRRETLDMIGPSADLSFEPVEELVARPSGKQRPYVPLRRMGEQI